MPVPPTSISAATITSHAMPIEMRMPVKIVAAAAGRITRKALRSGLTSSVLAALSQSRRTDATPKAVFISIGHTEQMKITKIPEIDESLIVYKASGIHANGEIGLGIWMNGFNARCISGDMPSRNPNGIGTTAAITNPSPSAWRTRPRRPKLPPKQRQHLRLQRAALALSPDATPAADSRKSPARSARHASPIAQPASSGPLDGKAVDVGVGLGRVEFLAHDHVFAIGAVRHWLAEFLHVFFGIGQQQHALGDAFVIDLAFDIAPAL